MNTERPVAGQVTPVSVGLLQVPEVPEVSEGSALPRSTEAVPSFDALYEAHLDFVWRSARRLGVPEKHLEDVTQDVFVVVHRRLADYDHRAAIRSWLFGIVALTVRGYRRTFARKDAPCVAYDDDFVTGEGSGSPLAAAEHAQRVKLMYRLLSELDQDKREVLVLAELEEMSVPEIAQCLTLNVNTAAARLRTARKAFEDAHTRHRARESHATRTAR